MAIDARYLTVEHIKTDVCIVGSGPAGLTLAREFIGEETSVVLLESGTTKFDPDTQKLAAGKTFGDPLIAPYEALNRQFGGLSNIWVIKPQRDQFGVRYAMFDEIDFEVRKCIPNSGWPFQRESLFPYIERAQKVCKIGPFNYEASNWVSDCDKELPFDGEQIETGIFQFGRRKVFHDGYGKEIDSACNIDVYHYANVVEVGTNEAGDEAQKVRVACLNGNGFWVHAKVIIIACGAFENARILLMSNKQHPQGVGNQNDVVGRYYHDHPTSISGYFTPEKRQLFDFAKIYDLKQVDGIAVQGYLRLPKKVLEKEQLSNVNTLLFPCPDERQRNALNAFKFIGQNLWRILKNFKARSESARQLSLPATFWPQFPNQILRMIFGIDAVLKAVYLWLFKKQSLFPQYASGGGWSELANNQSRFERFEMRHSIEQFPHPDNRVSLSPELDALGCPKLELHWHWHQEDAESFTRYVKFLSAELSRQGLGRFDYKLNDDGLVDIVRPSGSHHLMGTTRMHNDPKYGVVNANCQVHGISNLYIVGSSTFPTGGYANPTLTIVAMAIRMADQIKQRLNSQP